MTLKSKILYKKVKTIQNKKKKIANKSLIDQT